MIFILLVNVVLEKLVMTIIIFVFAKMTNLKASIKNCIRVVLFSNGVYVLLAPFALIGYNFMPYILMITQTWCAILMISGLMKLSSYKL